MTAARRWARPLLALLALQFLLFGAYRGIQRVRAARRPLGHAVESRPAPDFAYRDAAGAEHHLSELRGRVLLVHFWATWCPPCRAELPGLLEHARSSPQVVLAVSAGETREEVRRFFDGSWPSAVVVADGSTISRLGVQALPETWLVDAAGTIRLRFVGARDWTSPMMRDLLAQHSP